MKELKFRFAMTLRYLVMMTLPVTFSPLATAQAEVQGWEVNQETIVNLLNIQSRLGLLDNDTAELPGHINLIPVFQSLKISSPEMNGFRGMASITQLPQDYGSSTVLSDHKSARQLEARASYSSYFEKGSVNLWLGALWQEQEIKSVTTGFQTDEGSFGYNVGIDLSYAGFSITGSYYSGQTLDMLYFNPYSSPDSTNCLTVLCNELNNEGYVLKGAYELSQATKLGISYGESSYYTGMNYSSESASELWSVGLYHDVNSWFKIVAEYSNFKSSNYGFEEGADMISVGGFIRW